MMDFWVRADGQDQWQAVPHEGGILEPGLYTVIARSPQPHFTITVDIHHLQPGDPSPVQQPKGGVSPTLQERRSIRTNDEGVGVILPSHDLTPGTWEFHCHDADLIAELFGDARSDVLRLSIPGDPNLRTDFEQGQESEGETPEITEPEITEPEITEIEKDPEACSQRQEWPQVVQAEQPAPAQTDPFDDADAAWDPHELDALAQQNAGLSSQPPVALPGVEPVPFTLLHSQLQGDPGEVVVLTGRIGGPGDMEARVYADGEVVYESQRTIQFPPDARTAVFSLPIPLPATPWQQNLVGTLMLQPTSAQLPTSVSFTIARRTPPTPEPEVDPMVSPLARANRNSLSDPLSSRSAQSAPLHLGREAAPYLSGLTGDPAVAPTPVVSPLDPTFMPQAAQPSDFLQSDMLQVKDTNPRTLKRLLRFCQPTTPDETTNETTAAEITAHETVDPPPPISPEPQAPEAQRSEAQNLEPAEPDPTPEPPPPELLQPAHPRPVVQEPRVESDPKLPTPEPTAEPSPELAQDKQDRQDKRERATAMDPRPLPVVMHPFQEVASGSLPKPDLEVPLQIRAGETFDIKLCITCEAPPPWIKFRIRNGQNKSIADGPRCLIDYSQTGDNSWQTLTRLTIPHGIPELWFEAWVVSRDLNSEGSRVVVQRTVRD